LISFSHPLECIGWFPTFLPGGTKQRTGGVDVSPNRTTPYWAPGKRRAFPRAVFCRCCVRLLLQCPRLSHSCSVGLDSSTVAACRESPDPRATAARVPGLPRIIHAPGTLTHTFPFRPSLSTPRRSPACTYQVSPGQQRPSLSESLLAPAASQHVCYLLHTPRSTFGGAAGLHNQCCCLPPTHPLGTP
jgi:hypothetical protein